MESVRKEQLPTNYYTQNMLLETIGDISPSWENEKVKNLLQAPPFLSLVLLVFLAKLHFCSEVHEQ